MLANRSHVRFEFTNTKKLTKKLARIEASSICCQQFANLFADCFCAFHKYQLEFANTSLPTLVCRVKAALVERSMTSSIPLFAYYKNVNISKMKKDIPKRKTPVFFTLKSLSNKQQLFFTSLALEEITVVITCRAKLLNADWLRQTAFFLNQEGSYVWWPTRAIAKSPIVFLFLL